MIEFFFEVIHSVLSSYLQISIIFPAPINRFPCLILNLPKAGSSLQTSQTIGFSNRKTTAAASEFFINQGFQTKRLPVFLQKVYLISTNQQAMCCIWQSIRVRYPGLTFFAEQLSNTIWAVKEKTLFGGKDAKSLRIDPRFMSLGLSDLKCSPMQSPAWPSFTGSWLISREATSENRPDGAKFTFMPVLTTPEEIRPTIIVPTPQILNDSCTAILSGLATKRSGMARASSAQQRVGPSYHGIFFDLTVRLSPDWPETGIQHYSRFSPYPTFRRYSLILSLSNQYFCCEQATSLASILLTHTMILFTPCILAIIAKFSCRTSASSNSLGMAGIINTAQSPIYIPSIVFFMYRKSLQVSTSVRLCLLVLRLNFILEGVFQQNLVQRRQRTQGQEKVLRPCAEAYLVIQSMDFLGMWLDSHIRLVSIVDFPDWVLPIKTMLSRFMLIIIIEKFLYGSYPTEFLFDKEYLAGPFHPFLSNPLTL